MNIKPVITVADVERLAQSYGDRLEAKISSMAAIVGATQLGVECQVILACRDRD